ncbi:uncharacterized protein LOC126896688 [Daktulosphaira vitifoliae]|uniref:uncharacterized protein LOC126896688 n=1 Tax=Daktulosphaira vitifoliae TaxID=58002 RepID=UPI0021AA2606|nr:uncharacterized protein LOC126896688 [Daktulosphaira vitifoliae]XP_050525614.1 uncharacterized protein LOC126896688 [Daktulosphaira vitifoliae]
MQNIHLRTKKMINTKRNCAEIIHTMFYIKFEDNNFIKKFPDWEILPMTIENELIYAIRERDAIKKQLKNKRKDKYIFDKKMKHQWKDLKLKKKRLKEDEINYNQLSLEIKDKCNVLISKTREDIEEKNCLEIQIDPMLQSIIQIEENSKKMQRNVDQLKPFEDFLMKVIEEPKNCKTIEDMIKKYENLTKMKKELTQKYELKSLEMYGVKTDLYKQSKEKSKETENISDELADVTDCWVKTKENIVKVDIAFRHLENMAKEKNIEYDLITSSIWNIYEQTCKRVKYPVSNKKIDIETQLNFIANEYQELTKVLQMAKKIKEKIINKP